MKSRNNSMSRRNTIPELIVDYGIEGQPVIRRVSFSVESWSYGNKPLLSEPEVVGTKPLIATKSIG